MGVSITVALGLLTEEHRKDAEEHGVLDPEHVHFTFRTQEDEKVRPSHQALDGTVWQVGDPEAPVPPLDYGCRCFIEYNAKPGSHAERFLPPAESPVTDRQEAYAAFLDRKMPKWREITEALGSSRGVTRFARALVLVKEKRPDLSAADARDFARMLVQAHDDG